MNRNERIKAFYAKKHFEQKKKERTPRRQRRASKACNILV